VDCKTCTKCGESKPLDAFYAEKRNKDGRTGSCKSCADATSRAWAKANPEKVRANAEAWVQRHPEKRKAASRQWHANHPDKSRAAADRRDREKLLAGQAAWRARNAEQLQARAKAVVAKLAPSYIANTLRIPLDELTPELLALKREKIEMHRISKQIKNLMKDEK
jgi:phage/plasmid-associated DNA primase